MYDKKAEAEELFKEYISKFSTACHENGIPFLCVAAVADDGEKTVWKADGLTPGALGVKISEDRIRKAIAVLGGFEDLVGMKEPGEENSFVIEINEDMTGIAEAENEEDIAEYYDEMIREDSIEIIQENE